MLAAMLCGILRQRIACFSAAGRLRQCCTLSFQFMLRILRLNPATDKPWIS
jgi:hypothetical protein